MFDFRKYELSASHGYIPQQRPASTLPASHAVYEDLMHDPELHIAIQSHELRVKVDTLPNLNVANLGPAHKRRAYTLLSFVAHGYIWGNGTKTLSELPSQISEPLEYLSGEYGVHALGTYASTVLWNCWSELPLEEWKVENISASFTFTGSKDEEYFYAIRYYGHRTSATD
jgi:indoleamine 2,3-dioxygenase